MNVLSEILTDQPGFILLPMSTCFRYLQSQHKQAVIQRSSLCVAALIGRNEA